MTDKEKEIFAAFKQLMAQHPEYPVSFRVEADNDDSAFGQIVSVGTRMVFSLPQGHSHGRYKEVAGNQGDRTDVTFALDDDGKIIPMDVDAPKTSPEHKELCLVLKVEGS